MENELFKIGDFDMPETINNININNGAISDKESFLNFITQPTTKDTEGGAKAADIDEPEMPKQGAGATQEQIPNIDKGATPSPSTGVKPEPHVMAQIGVKSLDFGFHYFLAEVLAKPHTTEEEINKFKPKEKTVSELIDLWTIAINDYKKRTGKDIFLDPLWLAAIGTVSAYGFSGYKAYRYFNKSVKAQLPNNTYNPATNVVTPPIKKQGETRGRHKKDCQCPTCIKKRNK